MALLQRGRRCASVSQELRVALAHGTRVRPQVELREVQAEDLDAAAQRCEPAVGDPRTAVGAQAAVEQVELVEQIARPTRSRRPRSRCQIEVSRRRYGSSALLLGRHVGDGTDLRVDVDELGRDAPGPRELPHVARAAATGRAPAPARAPPRPSRGPRAGCRRGRRRSTCRSAAASAPTSSRRAARAARPAGAARPTRGSPRRTRGRGGSRRRPAGAASEPRRSATAG